MELSQKTLREGIFQYLAIVIFYVYVTVSCF